jgi:hypothetical protein
VPEGTGDVVNVTYPPRSAAAYRRPAPPVRPQPRAAARRGGARGGRRRPPRVEIAGGPFDEIG